MAACHWLQLQRQVESRSPWSHWHSSGWQMSAGGDSLAPIPSLHVETSDGVSAEIRFGPMRSDGSLLVRYRDQNREEKSLAYSARRKKWFPADAERPIAGLLKDLGLDMPTGTATALEAEKLISKARKWLSTRQQSSEDADEIMEDELDE